MIIFSSGINAKTYSITSLISNKNLNLTKKDHAIGNNLANLFELNKKGYNNKLILKNLYSKVKKNKKFAIYKDWVGALLYISKEKKISKIKVFCSKLTNTTETLNLSKVLLNNSTHYCFNKYLKLLSSARFSYSSHKKESLFFTKYFNEFASKSNRKSLINFYSKIKRKRSQHNLYSHVASNYYVTKGLTPVSKLLKVIKINRELTQYLQINGLSGSSTKSLFYNELGKLTKTVFKFADTESSKKQITASVDAMLNFYSLSTEHLPRTKSKKRLLSLGKSLVRREYFANARKIFTKVISKDTKRQEEVLYELLWSYIVEDQYSEAHKQVVKKYALAKNFSLLKSTKLLFWVSQVLKDKNDKSYRNIYEHLIAKDPLNYYSIIASKDLQKYYDLPSQKIFLKLTEKSTTPFKFLRLNIGNESKSSLARLKILSKLDYKPLLKAEIKTSIKVLSSDIKRINNHISKNKANGIATYMTAKALSNSQNFLESFKVVYSGIHRKALHVSEEILEVLFPMAYWQSIKRNVKYFDPIIALSLIRQESGFNRKARSIVGARGLMQLMPNTARQLRRRVKIKHLYNPATNIKLGTKYMENLLKRHDNNLVFSLASYNAGESRVNRWKEDLLTDDSILFNIERIPFRETRKYVKLIFRNIFFYKMLKESKAVKLADSKQHNQIFDVYLGFNN